MDILMIDVVKEGYIVGTSPDDRERVRSAVEIEAIRTRKRIDADCVFVDVGFDRGVSLDLCKRLGYNPVRGERHPICGRIEAMAHDGTPEGDRRRRDRGDDAWRRGFRKDGD